MRNVVSRAYFISAFQANETLEANRMRHAELMRVLASEGHNPTEVQGRYNGVDKLSVAVRGDQTLEREIIEMGMLLKQESILIVYWDGAAEFVSTKPETLGDRQVVGYFNPTNLLKQGQDFSRIGELFYIIEPLSSKTNC